jgi:hypothetical protein
MKHYKHVEFPHMAEIKKNILENLDKFFFKNTVFKVCKPRSFEFPELINAVETIKPWSEVSHISIIAQQPFLHIISPDTNIHQDVMSLTERGQEQPVCLNIPIYNCDETYVAIYKPLRDPYRYQGTYENGHTWDAWHWKQDWVEEIVNFHDETTPFAPENGESLKFKIGDCVRYMDYKTFTIIGLYPRQTANALYAQGARYLLDWDCPWMPVAEYSLALA